VNRLLTVQEATQVIQVARVQAIHQVKTPAFLAAIGQVVLAKVIVLQLATIVIVAHKIQKVAHEANQVRIHNHLPVRVAEAMQSREARAFR